MIALDADFMFFLLHPNPGSVIEPKTKKPVPHAKEKVEWLISSLEKAREKILIPTPALSEVLTLAMDKASDYLSELTNTYGFELASFDAMAAVEAAVATADAKKRGNKRGGSSGTWAKIKFDRQIVAIAKVRGVTAIYSNDEDIRRWGEKENIKVVSVWDLPDPPPKQTEMFEGGERE